MMRLHFLNVGHGDCTIIEFPSGRKMMVDINNAKSLDKETEKELVEYYAMDYSSYALNKLFGRNLLAIDKGYNIELTDPVDYYKSIWGTDELFRFVCTHPDMDHLSGLHRLYTQEKIGITNLWDSDHAFNKSDDDFKDSPYDKNDWDTYQELRKKTSSPKVLHLERHANAQYFNEDGIYLLASTKELKKLAHDKDEPNHLSYVLLIQYGKTKAILGGDATAEVWQDILDSFGSDFLKSSILKAAHHGRESGYHEEVVKAINPQYTIASVGKKPKTDATNKYNNYSENVWSTRWKGNIVLTCQDDGTIEAITQYDR